ncbi:MAG: alpha/beta hydrolase [Patescibacteria group bacterium]|jgi:fermentation-respiration switch protein FrsA (DUF1100 family)
MTGQLTLILWIILSCALFLILSFSVYCAERVIRQPRELRPDELKKYDLKGESVSFFSKDGLKLAGIFFRGTSPATVILLHGFSRSKEQLLPQAAFLHKAGFSILLFDFRASGESEGAYITFGQKEQHDLEGALRYLRTRSDVDMRRLGVFGFSMGGAVALLALGKFPEIKAVIVNSTFSRMVAVIRQNFRAYLPKVPFFPFGWIVLLYIKLRTGVYFPNINPYKALRTMDPRPLLIIHGTKDERIPFREALELFDSRKDHSELWSVDGADHHGTYTVAAREYESKVTSFFSRHLLME